MNRRRCNPGQDLHLVHQTHIMNDYERVLRAVIAILFIAFLDVAGPEGKWPIVYAVVAAYLMFSAYTGECIFKEYMFGDRNNESHSNNK